MVLNLQGVDKKSHPWKYGYFGIAFAREQEIMENNVFRMHVVRSAKMSSQILILIIYFDITGTFQDFTYHCSQTNVVNLL